MNIKLKKILAVLVVFGITCSAPLAMTAQAAEVDARTKIFGLDSLIAEVINTNPEIKLLDNQVKIQEKRHKDAIDNAEERKTTEWKPGSDLADNKRNILLYPVKVKNRLDDLKWERQNKERTLKADISKLYYQYVYKKDEIDAQTKTVERAKIELAAEQEKVRLGKSTSLSLAPSENAVEQANQKLAKLNSEHTTIVMKINASLNYDLDQKLKFNTETIKINEYKVNDLESLIEKRKAESNSIAKLKGQIEEAKIDAFAEYYERNNAGSNYELLEDKPKELENQIENEKYNIEQKIRTDYINILESYDSISIAKLQFDLSSKLFDVAEHKYEYDLISHVDYLKAAEDKENAMIQYHQAQLAYLTSVLDFKLYIDQL